MKLACVVGARPNFMKMAPLLRALDNDNFFDATLIHTGQHYDRNLSDLFFDQLEMRRPDISLNVGSGSQAVQTARVLEAFEQVLLSGPASGGNFDRVVVVGDVNSTLAATLAAVKIGIPVAHVEAGLRSFDRGMPEEINRILTDSVSDTLLVSEPSGVVNLKHEGHPDQEIHMVGNIMIDTLLTMLPKARESRMLLDAGLQGEPFGVVTLHRPANVDDRGVLTGLLDALLDIAGSTKLLFPIHPRTRARMEDFDLFEKLETAANIQLLSPLGYLDFLGLMSNACFVVTDSGGLQEETTVLGIPCLTLRSNTERPATVEIGSNTLIGNEAESLRYHVQQVLNGSYKRGAIPQYWDGHTAERIVQVLRAVYN